METVSQPLVADILQSLARFKVSILVFCGSGGCFIYLNKQMGEKTNRKHRLESSKVQIGEERNSVAERRSCF